MKLAHRMQLFLPLCVLLLDFTSATETTTEQIKSYGNLVRRVRAHRQKNESEKSKREIPAEELKRTERQANEPPADPSYDFAFRTPEYQRRESADNFGRVRGLYSFVDDVGEKHLVRYAASADRGFEVFNSVPDASKYVQYSAPLYKTSPKARGRIAYERGPGRQYKFISAGPDQRRSESTGPDGVVRGAYSYLDDKGIQRTTQYIAGAGIGYRVVQDTTGPGTHLLPRPAVVEFGILYPKQGGRGSVGNNGDPGSDFDLDRKNGSPNDGPERGGPGIVPGIGLDGSGGNGIGGAGSLGGDDNSIDSDGPFGADPGNDEFGGDNNRNGGRPGIDRGGSGNRGFGTLITNSGDTYFGIAPGASARAHVQNIDLKPYGEDGAISPSEALRRDERRSHRLRFRG